MSAADAGREPDADVRPALGEALTATEITFRDERLTSFELDESNWVPGRFDIRIMSGGQPGPSGHAFAGTVVTLARLYEREDGVLDAEFPEPNRITEAARRFLDGVVEMARQMGQESTPRTLVAEALHLFTNGENAPGGTETVAAWRGNAERYLRGETEQEGEH